MIQYLITVVIAAVTNALAFTGKKTPTLISIA